MPTPGVIIMPDGRKSFIPLENNPEVFTRLIHSLGVSESLEFYDVWGVDDPALTAHIPRPVLALIVIIPPEAYTKLRTAEGTRLAKQGLTYDKTGDEEPVLWFRQTIQNACGLFALIHSIANGAREYVIPDSLLDKLIKGAIPLNPADRAQFLVDSDELEEKHMAAARTGDTVAPSAEKDAVHHFEAFAQGKDGHLYELEGGTDGPLDRGLLEDGADMLSDEALQKGMKKFLNVADGQTDFSIIALAKKQ